MITIAAALLAALLYGAGAAAEQRQAARMPQSTAGKPRLMMLLARRPWWLAGLAAQTGGFAAHAFALRSGHLAVVQMLVAGELVVAVVLVRIWTRRPLSRGGWVAALAVTGAIGAFLTLTAGHGSGAHPAAPLNLSAAGAGAALAGCGALAALAAGLRCAGPRRAVLLAVAAGLADACSAVATLAVVQAASGGLAALVTSWPLYVLAVVGPGNVLLTQTAYQAARPLITLPVIAAVNPLVSVAVGVWLLGEPTGTGAAGAVGAGLAVVAASLALARLAREAPYREPVTTMPVRT